MPDSTWASSEEKFRSLRTNDTVTGVSGGVSPKTDAPGSVAALMPPGTWVGVFGPWFGAAAAPEAPARGATTAPTPSRIPAASRAFLIRIMSCAPSNAIAIPTVSCGQP